MSGIFDQQAVVYTPLNPTPDNIGTGPFSSLASSKFGSVSILLTLTKLLTESISILQNVAAAQADRLQILTLWQSAYTQLMGQVPTFTVRNPDNGLAIFKPGSLETTARAQANSWNAATIQNLTGYRTTIENNAKSMQTNINQSNDNVNQAANMLTSILQQFSTILSSLYR